MNVFQSSAIIVVLVSLVIFIGSPAFIVGLLFLDILTILAFITSGLWR